MTYYFSQKYLLLAVVAFSLFTAGHVILRKRDPRAAVNWILICILLPGIGAFIYWLGGVNRIKTRAEEWRVHGRWGPGTSDQEKNRLSAFAIGLPEGANYLIPLAQLSQNVTGHSLKKGNRVTPYHHGESAYPAMLQAIRNAQKSIYLSTYIFDTNRSGQEFIQELVEKAKAGVDVRLLIDGFGRYYSFPTVLWKLKKTKVRAYPFLPLWAGGHGIHLNLRNHRKLLIVDGKIGFAGGMNIGDRHLVLNTSNQRRVVDMHFSFEGPVVSQMERAFLVDWHFVTGEKDPRGDKNINPVGEAFCRGISAGPNEEFERLQWIVIGALASARYRVRIMTPYFIPDRALVAALNAAALRGVSVEIILPQKNNIPYIQWAGRAYLPELIEYGVKFYFQPPPFVHTKLFIVDDYYSLIGSMNLDPRSLRLNFEFNVEVYDQKLSLTLAEYFDEIELKSQKVTLAFLNQRSLATRLVDGAAKLLSPYL